MQAAIGKYDPKSDTWGGIRGRLNNLEAAGQGASAEASQLREKLGDLSRVLDDYKKHVGP